jgi:hypothetical protein
VDEPVPSEALNALNDTGLFQQVRPLAFDVA